MKHKALYLYLILFFLLCCSVTTTGQEKKQERFTLMGLGDSIDEVDELIKSGSKDWSQRKKDIESVQTATEKMAEYFQGTFKDKLKGTTSAFKEVFEEKYPSIISSKASFSLAIFLYPNPGTSTR